jgi:YD repeat-containing protein
MRRYPMKNARAAATIAVAAIAIVSLSLSCASPATAPSPSPMARATPSPSPKAVKTVTVRTYLVSKESNYFSDGLLDQYRSYKYDDAKRLLLGETLTESSSNRVLEIVAYEYSEDYGKGLPYEIRRKVFSAPGKIKYTLVQNYDKDGLLLAETQLDASNAPVSYSEYDYDKSGNKTEWRSLDASKNRRSTVRYSYQGGKLKRIEILGASDKLDSAINVSYDVAGNRAEDAFVDDKGNPTKREAYEYQGGLLSAQNSYEPAKVLRQRQVFERDAAGNVAKRSVYDSSSRLRSYVVFEYVFRDETKTVPVD